MIEGDGDGRHGQRNERTRRRRRAGHFRNEQRAQFGHLMRLCDQDATVGRRAQHFAASSALRERDTLQRRNVHHFERRTGELAVRQVRGDK